MDTLRQDLRFAFRTIRRAPLVAGLAVLSIGLGIGAVTTAFSSALAFTFRPLPQVVKPGGLVQVAESPAVDPGRYDVVSAGALADLRSVETLGDVAAYRLSDANVIGVDGAERVRGARVSANLLHALGREPALGRDFRSAEDVAGAERVVLLGFGLWQRRFGGDTALVGRTITINGEPFSVVGILPEDMAFPAAAQLWVPLALGSEEAVARHPRNLVALARLSSGASLSRAAAEVAALGERLATAYPEASDGWVLRAQPAERYYGQGPRPFMVVLLGAVAFVLLISCANVANLLLVRATGRRREVAVRVSLSASRGRILRQLLTESVGLALLGGALGVVVAVWGVAAMRVSVPPELRQIIPGYGSLLMDGRALAFAAAVSMASGILFGLAPALAATRIDAQQALKDAAPGVGAPVGRVRNALVIAEVTLAMVLLVGATAMLASFRRLLLSDPGFGTAGVLTLSVTLPPADYPRESAAVAFYDRLVERVATLPGVEAVGATSVLPMTWSDHRTSVEVEGRPPHRPGEAPLLGLRVVTPGYLSTLRVPFVRGRDFTAADADRAPAVALVSDAAARRLWPGESPVGRRLRVRRERRVEVVGVVGNVRANVLVTDDPMPVLYLPHRQWTARSMTLVVRTPAEPMVLAPAIQREIAVLDARLAAGDVASLARVVASNVSPQRATAQSLVLAAFLALVMAAVGIYGVMAYLVAQRTHEIGVRVALGATRGDILRLVFGRAGSLTAAGIALGVVGVFGMARALRTVLYETSATEPVAVGCIAVLLVAVALAATYLPARRALRIEPTNALRYE